MLFFLVLGIVLAVVFFLLTEEQRNRNEIYIRQKQMDFQRKKNKYHKQIYEKLKNKSRVLHQLNDLEKNFLSLNKNKMIETFHQVVRQLNRLNKVAK